MQNKWRVTLVVAFAIGCFVGFGNGSVLDIDMFLLFCCGQKWVKLTKSRTVSVLRAHEWRILAQRRSPRIIHQNPHR
jgi:hypothetical protein